jgi:hypothetical protein
MLIVTTRAIKDNFSFLDRSEFKEAYLPPMKAKTKKHIVVTGRVHPGESNGSWMMEGFIRFITGESIEA